MVRNVLLETTEAMEFKGKQIAMIAIKSAKSPKVSDNIGDTYI